MARSAIGSKLDFDAILLTLAVDPATSVRYAVLQGLHEHAWAGDQVIIVAVAGRAKDLDVNVRLAALDVLVAFVEKGNMMVADGACKFLADPDWEIRQSAVELLGELAKSGVAPTMVDIRETLQWWNLPQVATVLVTRQFSQQKTPQSSKQNRRTVSI